MIFCGIAPSVHADDDAMSKLVEKAIGEKLDALKQKDDALNEVKALKDSLKNSQKNIKDFQNKLKKAEEKTSKLDAELQKLKNNKSDSIINAQKEEIIKLSSERIVKQRADSTNFAAAQDSIKLLKEQIEKLISENNDLNDKLKAVPDSTVLADLKKQNEELKADNEKLEKYRTLSRDEIIAAVDGKWLKMPYKDVNFTSLESDCKAMQGFMKDEPKNAKLAAAEKKLSGFHAQATAYAEGKKVIESRFNKQQVDAAKNKINNVLKQITDNTHQTEMQEMRSLVADYDGALLLFDEMITAANEIVDQNRSKSNGYVWGIIKSAFENEESGNVGKAYVKEIRLRPWLGQKYDQYLKELQADAKAPSKTAIEITELIKVSGL